MPINFYGNWFIFERDKNNLARFLRHSVQTICHINEQRSSYSYQNANFEVAGFNCYGNVREFVLKNRDKQKWRIPHFWKN